MTDEEPTTLVGVLTTVLVLPFGMAMRAARRDDGSDEAHGERPSALRSVLVLLAFVPIVLLYEAFALPLVLGAVIAAILVTSPAALVALGAYIVTRGSAKRRRAAGVLTVST